MGAAEPDGAIKDTGIELQMALESLRQIVCTGWERPLAWATLRGAGGLDEAVSMDRRLRASKVEPAIAVLAPGGEDVGHEASHYLVGDARQGRGQFGWKPTMRRSTMYRLRPKGGGSAVAGAQGRVGSSCRVSVVCLSVSLSADGIEQPEKIINPSSPCEDERDS